MPELAEVEYYRKEWDPALGDPIITVKVHPLARIYRDTSPQAIQRHLPGESLIASFSHGKQMLFQFGAENWLGLHLGMSGQLRSQPPDYTPAKHDHLVIKTLNHTLVFCVHRMFGKVTFDRCKNQPEWWQALPPGVTSAKFTRQHMRAFLHRFQKTPVKTVLLDQRGFPGIGNWMADEICWRIKVAPSTPCGELDETQLTRLWKTIRELARQSLRIIGHGWQTPPNNWLFNHRWKDGGHCPRKGCRAALNRSDLRGRTTCWCPNCQGLR